MTTKLTHAAVFAAVVGATTFAALAGAAQAADAPKAAKEKCYGISKAGENSCAAGNGSHSCAGQSKAAFNGQEFKEVPAGSCEKMEGSLKAYDGMNPKKKG